MESGLSMRREKPYLKEARSRATAVRETVRPPVSAAARQAGRCREQKAHGLGGRVELPVLPTAPALCDLEQRIGLLWAPLSSPTKAGVAVAGLKNLADVTWYNSTEERA